MGTKSRAAGSMTEIYEGEHFVSFYTLDRRLISDLKGFVGGGLKAADVCIVIATKEHIAELNKLLADEAANQPGLDPTNYIALDAAETLAGFMDGNIPDGVKFRQVIGGVIKKHAKPGQKIRAFGEMVSILWAQDNQAGAVLLEQLWNRLARDQALTLFCAYPSHHFERNAHTEMLDELKALHTSYIVPA